tara:strand:+ start:2683 stop:3453 length:771 start_codon:yes stop_codon:yes gene_type:complete
MDMKYLILGTTLLCTFTSIAISDDGIAGLAVNGKGLVGVGTNNPQHTLHVAGDAKIEGMLYGDGFQGRFGNATVLVAQQTIGSDIAVTLSYEPTTSGPAQIRFNAIDPVNPGQSHFKTFVINHPQDENKYLVHATIEGPEGAVYYRGSSSLMNGRITVELPEYFESLTRKDGRTIQLTNIDGFDKIAIKRINGEKINLGKFVVISNSKTSYQSFDWEVKAVRADGPELVVEPRRSNVDVASFGPYTFGIDKNVVER